MTPVYRENTLEKQSCQGNNPKIQGHEDHLADQSLTTTIKKNNPPPSRRPWRPQIGVIIHHTPMRQAEPLLKLSCTSVKDEKSCPEHEVARKKLKTVTSSSAALSDDHEEDHHKNRAAKAAPKNIISSTSGDHVEKCYQYNAEDDESSEDEEDDRHFKTRPSRYVAVEEERHFSRR